MQLSTQCEHLLSVREGTKNGLIIGPYVTDTVLWFTMKVVMAVQMVEDNPKFYSISRMAAFSYFT